MAAPKEVTIFSVPKPFRGHVALIQRNALRSWLRLGPTVEVVLYGNEYGVGENAQEFGVVHVPMVDTSKLGTPLISSVFESAAKVGKHPWLCYVNADIILLDDFVRAADRIEFARFLMVGQRWGWDVREELDLTREDFDDRLRGLVRRQGQLDPPFGSDYFLFQRDTPWRMPPFVVGRPSWDNWLIYRALELRLPVVDATPSVTAIHQNHDYSHIPRGLNLSWEGPEANANRSLAGPWKGAFALPDATHVLEVDRLARAPHLPNLRRRALSLPIRLPRLQGVFLRMYRNALKFKS